MKTKDFARLLATLGHRSVPRDTGTITRTLKSPRKSKSDPQVANPHKRNDLVWVNEHQVRGHYRRRPSR